MKIKNLNFFLAASFMFLLVSCSKKSQNDIPLSESSFQTLTVKITDGSSGVIHEEYVIDVISTSPLAIAPHDKLEVGSMIDPITGEVLEGIVLKDQSQLGLNKKDKSIGESASLRVCNNWSIEGVIISGPYLFDGFCAAIFVYCADDNTVSVYEICDHIFINIIF